jgi:hypothetical protein
MRPIRKTRLFVVVAMAAAAFLAVPEMASAQPQRGISKCGGHLPPGGPIGNRCRWVCVRQTLGDGDPRRPPSGAAPQRMVWKKLCSAAPSEGPVRGRRMHAN